MAKETLEPVPVIIDNLEALESSADSVRFSTINILNLLNGQDYKKKINDIEKNTRLLNDIKKSLDSISTKITSTPTPSSHQSLDQQELRNTLNQILQAVQNLRSVGGGNGGSPTPTPTPGTPPPSHQEGDITKQQRESQKKALENARDSIEKILKEEQHEIKSQRDAYENALGAISEGQQKQSAIMDTLSGIGRNFLNLFTSNFRKVFDTWDRQIATLKETGMGAQNAAELNRITKQTMNAAEETLGWNISIEKAIKATNSMLAAGQNPRYIRENNRQLITGLEGLGLSLQPSTIRAIGQSVYESSQVKEIAEGFAKLMSPDTENAIGKGELESFLNSDDYKKLRATMGMYGVSQAELQKELIAQMEESVRGGATGRSAIAMAMMGAQGKFTGGNVIVTPENVQDYIGIAQAAGTFTNLGNISRDFSEAIRRSKSNPLLNQQFRQIAASTAMNNDFTVLENVIDNDGHTRRIATHENIEQGQYEGLIPRIAKSIAGHLPAESIGGMSQRLTGDSGFLTQQSFDLVGALAKSSFETGKLLLLGKIAANTGPEGSLFKNLLGTGGAGGVGGAGGGAGGALGKLGGLLGKAGPIALGVAAVGVTAGLVYSAYEEHSQAADQEKSDRETAEEFYQQELELQNKFNEARLAGNEKLADEIRKQLNEAREKTNQQLDKVTEDQENQSDAWVKGGSVLGGAAAGALIGSIIPGVGTAIGAGIGAIVGGLGGYFISDAAVKSDLGSPDYDKGRAELRRDLASKGGRFAAGGVITEEQLALVGEGNNPEMVIPLNNSDRARSLLQMAEQVIGSSDRVTQEYITSEMMPIIRLQESDTRKILDTLNEYFRMKNNAEVFSSLGGLLSFIPGVGPILGALASKAGNVLPRIGHFADGGIINKEQTAIVGEGDKPEVVIPLTNPDRAEELLSTAANMPSTNPDVANMLSSPKKGSVADLIIKAAKSMAGVPYRNGGDSFNHPERGLVCNMLVEYAYHTAGIDIKKGTVNDNVYKHRNDWVFTDKPQPGYVIFSNYGERSKYGGSKGYQHMGIMGYGNERIHASSFGKVVINPDYTKGKSPDGSGGVSWELSSRWTGKGNQKPLFAYLRGVDYGTGVEIPEEDNTPVVEQQESPSAGVESLPSVSGPADFSPFENEEEAEVSKEVSPRIMDQLRYQKFLSDVSPEVTILSPDVVKDILYSKGLNTTDEFYTRIASNNPFGLRNIDDSLQEFSSLDVGVQAFISKIERMYDQLAEMNYRQQLDLMKDKHYITASEHFHSTQLQADRLAQSLDNLNTSVRESNRLASQSQRVPNMTAIPGRRYT